MEQDQVKKIELPPLTQEEIATSINKSYSQFVESNKTQLLKLEDIQLIIKNANLIPNMVEVEIDFKRITRSSKFKEYKIQAEQIVQWGLKMKPAVNETHLLELLRIIDFDKKGSLDGKKLILDLKELGDNPFKRREAKAFRKFMKLNQGVFNYVDVISKLTKKRLKKEKKKAAAQKKGKKNNPLK
ncbi:hypothetical protein GJ496_002465 [Pomphorhynchus laevis]|nr:hypothetical protein GJ496_002465 [Pomphorhynchus laevis]